MNPGDTSHCIVTRFGPLIDIDLVWSAKRGDRCGPRTPLELIVIAERKARINMQQTERGERERGKGKEKRIDMPQHASYHGAAIKCGNCGTQLGMRAKKCLSLAKLKSMKLAIKIRLPPLAHPFPSCGCGTVAWEPCVHSSGAWSTTLVEVSANVCHIIDDDCHRNSLVFSTF